MVTILVLIALGLAILGIGSELALWRARVAIESREHHAAATWLRVASWSWVRGPEWYYLSAILSRRADNFEQLHMQLDTAFRNGWNVKDLEHQQLLALAQSGQFAEVGDQWAELFENAGSDGPEICKSFVNYCLSRFQIAEASKVIDAWQQDFPEDAEAWYVEGRILVVLQRWSDAERVLQEAIRRDPHHVLALKQLGLTFIKQLKFEEAETVLGNAALEQPGAADIQASLAHCQIQLGRTDEASATLKAAIETHKDHPELLAELGRLQLALGKPEQAIQNLSRVISIQPENTELRYSLALALRGLGREEESQQHFKVVDEGTKALLQLSKLTAQVVDDPANVELRFKVAEITWKWKSRTDGEAWLKSVLEYDANHKPTHRLLAEHYTSAGKPELAKHHRQLAATE